MSHTPSQPQLSTDEKADKRLNKRLKDMPIAIVGMASIFANSRYLNKFWDLICDKIDAITDVPESHWSIDDYYDADKSKADKSYCKRGGFMPEVDFNPMEFGLPPNILELTDSSQLLSLVVAKEVLQDANLPDDYDRDRIGITLGIGGGQKLSHSLNARLQYPVLKKVFKSSGLSDDDSELLLKKFQDQYVHWEENSFPGSLGNVIAGRIANRFDLGGMNCVVDAACAGSLAAMRMALTELTEGRSDMMITGGVCTDNSPYMYMSFSKTPAFTTNEQIQPFDIDSKGMMIGEGIGMVALKRLDDAERDGDRIYAVIKGVGASSDGKFKSIYAPRPEGQAKALERAYDDAGFAPHTVGLIEAHGTGTAAGDVAEFNGLTSVFSKDNEQLQHIALGSVKSQVGHTKSTAGTAGVIKAALALHHKVLPPTINVSQPNPKLNIAHSPFYLNTEARPWIQRSDDTPRRAGISSFGFGGTNFHLVLEEYHPEHARDDAYRQRSVAQSWLFAAADKTALLGELKAALRQATATKADLSEAHFVAFAKSYALRELPPQSARLGFIAKDYAQLQTLLTQAIAQLESNSAESWQLPSGISFRAQALVKDNNKVAALFAGQGSQYLNMGLEIANNFPELRRHIHASDKVFSDRGEVALSSVLYPIPAFDDESRKAQESALTNTLYAQSAIGALSMAQYALFTQAGFAPDMLAGHSFGELSALCAAGVISVDDYIKLAFERGQAMAQSPLDADSSRDAGVMYAVILKQKQDIEAINDCLAQYDNVKIANYNSPTQLVIAGATTATQQAAKAIGELGFKAIALPVSGAFHTPLVAHAQKPFSEAIDKAQFNTPKIALYANGTGELHPTDANAIKTAFKDHMLQSVHFSEQLEAMYAAGARVFVEFGPKNILQKLAENTLAAQLNELCLISINPNPKADSDSQLRSAAVQLAVAGVKLGEIDPYQAELIAPATPSAMNIKLNATNYISPATRNKMVDSLQSGKITSQVQYVDRLVEKVVEKVVEKPVIVEKILEKVVEVEKPVAQNSNTIQQQTPAQPACFTAGQANQDALSAFFAAQTQAAQLHQQFLAIPQQYGHTVSALMAEQAKMASLGIAIPESLQRSMELFHQHQAQTLKSHAEFMQLQTSSSQAALALLGQMPAPQVQAPIQAAAPVAVAVATPVAPTQAPVVQALVAEPKATVVPVSQPQSVQLQSVQPQVAQPQVQTVAAATRALSEKPVVQQIETAMLAVVADKTGYPVEMLELSMDMEADLGIDSIKRVEILGTVQDELPNLPELSPEDLAECRTLGEIVALFSQATPVTAVTASPQSITQTAVATNAAVSNDEIERTMMAVVADKTGYPVEMLELSMDMEADLGIDSIKRVEILGTVQDELPKLPELSPEDLAECRTLGEIVALFSQVTPVTPASTVSHAAQTAVAANAAISNDEIERTMMAVVADKTGYPVEMLELSMDMEADLGIDSIKRVEILGTVQDQLPNLPELSPEDLAECRTLGEIVALYAGSQSSSEALQPNHAVPIQETVVETEETIDLPPHSEVMLKKLPAAAELARIIATSDVQLTANSYVLIGDDGHNAGVIAEKLHAQGVKVAVVRSPKTVVTSASPLDSHIASFTLEAIDDESICEVINQIEALGQIAGFVHLQPQHKSVADKGAGLVLADDAKASVEQAFLFAKHLQPLLTERDHCRFVTVSRIDGGFGYIGMNESAGAVISQSELNQAALSGLTKTLNHEWPGVVCRALDIAPNLDAKTVANAVVQEYYLQDAPVEVGIDSELERATLVAGNAVLRRSSASLSSADKILVTGGAKGVTFECALSLAKRCKAHFILAGRSAHQGIPAWAQGKNRNELKAAAIAHLQSLGDKPTPKQVDALVWPVQSSLEISHALQAFEAVGASAEYLSLDVNDPAAIASTIAPISALSPITGIIHGAGVLADKHIQDKTLSELERVYGTKVTGLNNLLSALDLSQLTLIALFSSAAGFYGNTGQSDYAMSNDILNKAALQLAQQLPQAKVMSFDWGPWDGGMVNPALKKMFIDRGVYVIPLKAGAELFASQLLSDTGAQLLVGTDMQGNTANAVEAASAKKPEADLTTALDPQPMAQTVPQSIRVMRSLDPKRMSFIEDHCINGHAVLPTVCAIDWMREAAKTHLGKAVSVSDYRLLKGIIFDEALLARNAPIELELMLTPLADATQQSTEALAALISFEGRPQYQAVLVAQTDNTPDAQRFEVGELHSLMEEITQQPAIANRESLYNDGTLFHGPRLQGISEVLAFDDQQLIAKVALPAVALDDCGEFAPNLEDKGTQPFAEDLLLQAMLVWARLKYQAASLPSAIGEFVSYSPLGFGEKAVLVLDVIKHSSRTLEANIALYHQDGRLSCEMKRAKVTVSKTLNQAFMANKPQQPMQVQATAQSTAEVSVK
ncbi:SDR family NAD(P)-dependent oxidoreductase [Shewanella sp. FJAT-51649]|uniref:type I polyketide synthase n=1 Tax=Shewanella sp. FJAT-51649 TaxID=2864210 RepID=UPI001C661960|nr:type I polyketide synthase [Shewanella sp. FJAT-51649]QYJ70204.1 SDR family NAD(P)-dependent oxidoreductase [Shewanella sp. FJAT-51649]